VIAARASPLRLASPESTRAVNLSIRLVDMARAAITLKCDTLERNDRFLINNHITDSIVSIKLAKTPGR